jgi:phospholipase/carboxylesterase
LLDDPLDARFADARRGRTPIDSYDTDAALREVLPRLAEWPDRLVGVRQVLTTASEAALAAFDELHGVADSPDGMRAVYRALRHAPRAQEALYLLAGDLPPVSRFFLEPGVRNDAALIARLAEAPVRDDTGVVHVDNEPGSRGGYSLYAPEYYDDTRAWPLVFALHGGAGNGRAFLWSWLRDARSHGAILVSPTAVGSTWALAGRDVDTPNLKRILADVQGRYRIDPERILLGGMSDGGTFSYVSGLEADSPFTHLAPTAASFHPILAQMADADRLRGLPIHITHGALDWMFNIAVARQARDALSAGGAQVTYVEIGDLSHTYPREANGLILDWLGAP